MKTIVFDIDGVLADCTHRLHFIQQEKPDWDGFFSACAADNPIASMVAFHNYIELIFNVVYVTGRPERSREATTDWLEKHLDCWLEEDQLFMRADGDHRQDFEVKRDILAKLDRNNILAVIEDRDQVVKMWRDEGFLCLQPKKGDY